MALHLGVNHRGGVVLEDAEPSGRPRPHQVEHEQLVADGAVVEELEHVAQRQPRARLNTGIGRQDAHLAAFAPTGERAQVDDDRSAAPLLQRGQVLQEQVLFLAGEGVFIDVRKVAAVLQRRPVGVGLGVDGKEARFVLGDPQRHEVRPGNRVHPGEQPDEGAGKRHDAGEQHEDDLVLAPLIFRLPIGGAAVGERLERAPAPHQRRRRRRGRFFRSRRWRRRGLGHGSSAFGYRLRQPTAVIVLPHLRLYQHPP